MYAQYEAVLAREQLFARCRLSSAEREELLDIYLARCRWTRLYFLWRPNLRDESDNHLVELAVAGGAQAIVTRNKRDFRGAELRFESLAVLTPAECLRRKTWQP
jgi:predicted nucleic acid-binding protein